MSFPIHVKYVATLLWRDVLRRDITNTPLMSIMGVWIWTINGEDGGFNRWWANYFSTYIFSLLCVKKHRNPNDNNRENLVDNWWGKDFFLHFNFICEYCYHWLTLVLASALCYNWMMDRRLVSDIGCQPAPPSHCIGCICFTFLHCVFLDKKHHRHSILSSDISLLSLAQAIFGSTHQGEWKPEKNLFSCIFFLVTKKSLLSVFV